MRLLLVAALALAGSAWAQTLVQPDQSTYGTFGPAQTTTGASANAVDVHSGFYSLVTQYTLNSGTSAVVETDINCEKGAIGSTLPAGAWQAVSNSSFTITTAAPTAYVGITYPDCAYRTNITNCSTCNVTTKYKLGIRAR